MVDLRSLVLLCGVVSTSAFLAPLNHETQKRSPTPSSLNSSAIRSKSDWFQSSLSKPNVIRVENQTRKRGGFTNYSKSLSELAKEGTVEAAIKAQEILEQLETSSRGNRLSVVLYSKVINAWANVGDCHHAKAILDRMIQDDNIIHPNAHCFSGVMKAFIRSADGTKSKGNESQSILVTSMCEDLLTLMSELYAEKGTSDLKPNTIVYNTLLRAYVEEAGRHLGISRHNSPLLKSFGRNRRPAKQGIHFVEKAVSLLNEMESDSGSIAKPDVYSYCTVISALAKCGDVSSAELAESYLNRNGNAFDTPSYNAVLAAWANTGTRKGAERCNKLLDKLETVLEEGTTMKVGVGPNSISYHTTISAWTKSCGAGDGGHAAEQAEHILHRMENQYTSSLLSDKEKGKRFQPNVIAYSSIIDCWSKIGSLHGAQQAEELLHRMETLSSSGENCRVKPNIVSFSSVLTAYGRLCSEEGAKRADGLLQYMKERHNDTNDNDMKPNVVSYFAVIDSWARSNSIDAGIRCTELLEEMETLYREGDKRMKPDVRVYARVVSAHVKSRRKGSDNAAEKLVNMMERYSKTGHEDSALAKPNVVIYNTLISSYGKRGDARRALRVLNQMDAYNAIIQTEQDKIRADEHSLNGVIHALSICNEKGKARTAMKILERLERSHIDGDWNTKPTSRTYNMVIKACSSSYREKTKEKQDAINIALSTYKRLRTSSYGDCDRFTFISMLKTVGKLLPSQSELRQKYAVEFFQTCCEEGLLDESILENFLRTASKEVSNSTLSKVVKDYNGGTTDDIFSTLPKEWSSKSNTLKEKKNADV